MQETNALSKFQERYSNQIWQGYRIWAAGSFSMNTNDFDQNERDVTRTIRVQNYQMMQDDIPIGTVENFAGESMNGMWKDLGLDMWNNWRDWREEYNDLYGWADSIQGGQGSLYGNRMKVHGELSYKTTDQDKTLKRCKMTFETMFRTRRERKYVKRFLHNLYLLGIACGMKDIEFLKDYKQVVYLTSIYNGVGICTHIDRYFKGPVFCYVSYIKCKKCNVKVDSTIYQGKCLSFGMTCVKIDNP